MLGNISTLTINVKSHGWFRNSQQYINNKTNSRIRNIQQDINNKTNSRIRNIQQGINIRIKTNSSLYVYYDVPEGRLGNKLFGFASLFGIAHHSNRQLLYKSDLKRLNYLFPDLNLNKEAPPSWDKWARIKEKKILYFDDRFFNLPESNVTIGGYLQSFKYLENVSKEIFKIYSNINPSLLKKVKSFKESAKQEARKILSYHNSTTVCVHVRRDDFASKVYVDRGFKVPKAEDMHFAMKWMERKFNQVLFFVASNDKKWCQMHLKKENVFISNFTSAEDDYTLMQSCDHMIMTLGTFGWWAAWMTSQRGGDVMYYRDPFIPGSRIDRQFERKTHYPGHWLAYTNNSVIQSKEVEL